EIRRVSEIEIRCAYPEVHARRGLDAVRAAAVIDVVQVELEDLGLRAIRLELQRDERLMRLAQGERGRIVRKVEPPRELLGDRRRARRRRGVERAADRDRVDAEVPQEPTVLRG